MALLNFLIPLFYAAYFFGELPRIRLLGSVIIGPVDLAVLILFIYWVLKIKKSKKYFLEKPIIIFSLVAFLSLVINVFNFSFDQLLVSFLYLFRWILYSSIYFIVKDIGGSKEKIFSKLITLTGSLLIVVGILQLLFYPSLLGMYHLGWDKHLNRIFSTFLDPNFAGVIFVLFFIFIYVFREKIFGQSKKLAFVTLCITFVSIILTYSRGAILMYASSAFFFAFIKKDWKIFSVVILVLLTTFILLVPGFNQEGTNLLRTVSTNHRISSSVKALEIFKHNPMGVGFDTYRYAREKYGEIDFALAGPSHSGAGVDNSLIFVLVTAGFLGLVSYLYLLKKMLQLGFSKIKNSYGLVLVVSLAGLIFDSLTINSLFYSFIMLWVWVLAGLTESN